MASDFRVVVVANPNTPTVQNLFNPNDLAGGTVYAAAACKGQAVGAP